MKLTPEQIEIVRRASTNAMLAPRGTRGAVVDAACEQLGCSRQTFFRWRKEVAYAPSRVRRSDAGQTTLPRDEAEIVSAAWLVSIRKNGKQTSSLDLVVERLRSNHEIRAEYVDKRTGEVRHLSTSAIARALRRYGLHPEQLLQPAPTVRLASEHPNQVWQIDASICTQFYLPEKGLTPMNRMEYYEGKPDNLESIKRQRLWRYVITDHTSGTLYVEYVLGAESAENLCKVLINAMQERPSYPFYGVPFVLMTDPGAAMKSSAFSNLCRWLQIKLIINEVGNARAKGQVEQAHNIVECHFESGLAFRPTETLDQLNLRVARWYHAFNWTAVHSRTQSTRYSIWMHIKPEELRLAPSVEVCRQLTIEKPVSRRVKPELQVSFRGKLWDVSSIENVMVGEKIDVTRNIYNPEEALIIRYDNTGRERHHVVPEVKIGEFGFPVESPVIGKDYAAHKDTPAQRHKKQAERLIMGAETDQEAADNRKRKQAPFEGRIDPDKHMDVKLPEPVPRAGSSSSLTPPMEVPRMPLVAAGKYFAARLGPKWRPIQFAWVKKHHPEGVPEDLLDAVEEQLSKGAGYLSVVENKE